MTATAVDKAGHSTTSSPITITVNGIPVSLIEPTAGASFSTSNMSVAVQAAISVPTNLVAHVDFYDTANGTPVLIGTPATAAPYTCNWTATTVAVTMCLRRKSMPREMS